MIYGAILTFHDLEWTLLGAGSPQGIVLSGWGLFRISRLDAYEHTRIYRNARLFRGLGTAARHRMGCADE